jgi:hypothetical protein
MRHLCAQVRTSWAWATLDREIAAGAPLDVSEARCLRAWQLDCPEERRAIAAALRNGLDAAEARNVGRRQARDPITSARPHLLHLIELLRSDVPMSPRALALAELLACDRRSSPLLTSRATETIDQVLEEIARAR